jgi:hypothetical protein
VADHRAAVDEALELRLNRREGQRVAEIGVSDPVDRPRGGGDRPLLRDEALKNLVLADDAAAQPHGADLDEPRGPRVEPSGLGVEDDRVEREKRRVANHLPHAKALTFPGNRAGPALAWHEKLRR